jgi:tetratricopeptide (TPR) repeat protein
MSRKRITYPPNFDITEVSEATTFGTFPFFLALFYFFLYIGNMAYRSVLFVALSFSMVVLCACRDGLISRGNDALRIGDYDRAVKNFSAALDDNPYYAIAEDREKLKGETLPLWERTVAEFRILWNVDSTSKIREAYSNSLFYLAKSTLGNNSRANVLPLLDRSIALDSANFFSFNLKALIFENLGRTDEAKDIYIFTITRDSSFVSAYVNLGNLYWREGDVPSAWDIWSMGLKQDSTSRSLRYWTAVAEDSLKSMIDSGKL